MVDLIFKVSLEEVNEVDKEEFEEFIVELLESILTAEFTQNNVTVKSVDKNVELNEIEVFYYGD